MQEFMLRIKNKVVGIVIFVVLSFFIFRHTMLVDASLIGTFSSYLVYPFLRMQQMIIEPVQVWLSRCISIRELEEKLVFVSQQNEILTAENISLKALGYYAEKTAELRNFNQRYLLDKGRIAHVLARHFSSSNQFFLMNAGMLQGVRKDMVALYCNAIVGRVSEVYPWYCKVHLITDAECKVAAVCPQAGASGIHEGLNDVTHTSLCYVSHLETVLVHSMVFSSGEGLIFPSGFALGTVEAAHKGELFYSIDVKPTVDFYALSYCTLIAKDEIEIRTIK